MIIAVPSQSYFSSMSRFLHLSAAGVMHVSVLERNDQWPV